MNHTIANILKECLKDLDFVDKISGLVQTVYLDVTDDKGIRVNKSYPASCDIDFDVCQSGSYLDLTPDSSKRSVLYFEDQGVNFIRRESNFIYYRSRLRLVCWLNMARLGNDSCNDGNCSMSAEVIKKILCAFPQVPSDYDTVVRLMPVVVSTEVRSNAIFSAYTYNEKQTQYLMSPYDYFALNIETTFAICMADCST